MWPLYVLTALALLFIIVVLLQQKSAGLGSMAGSDAGESMARTRRGADLFLHQATIVLGILLLVGSFGVMYTGLSNGTPTDATTGDDTAAEAIEIQPGEVTVNATDADGNPVTLQQGGVVVQPTGEAPATIQQQVGADSDSDTDGNTDTTNTVETDADVSAAIEDTAAGLGGALGGALDTVSNAVDAVEDTVEAAAESAGGALDTVSNAVDAVEDTVEAAAESAEEAVEGVVDGAEAAVESAADTAAGAAAAAGGVVVEGVDEAIDAINGDDTDAETATDEETTTDEAAQ